MLFPTFCPEQTPVVLGTTRVQGPFRNFTFLFPTFCLDLTPAVLARKFGNESETCSFHSFLAAPPWTQAGYCQHGSVFFSRHKHTRATEMFRKHKAFTFGVWDLGLLLATGMLGKQGVHSSEAPKRSLRELQDFFDRFQRVFAFEC